MLAGLPSSERRKLLAGNVRNAAHVNTKDVFGEHGTTEATAVDVAWMPNGTGSVTVGRERHF